MSDLTIIWLMVTFVSTTGLALVAHERGRTPAWGLLGLAFGVFGLLVGVLILVAVPRGSREV